MSEQLRLAERLQEKARAEERLERLVARCGSAFHLVPDTLLLASNIGYHHPVAEQARIIRMELDCSVDWLQMEPLMTALQAGWVTAASVQCRHCQPSELLTVRSSNFSGSSAENLSDLLIGVRGTSDYDIMLEFGGPFRWAAKAGTGAGCISPEATPQLCAEPASSPGFVNLYWVRTSRCCHKAPLAALPAHYIRRLIWYHCRAISPLTAEITRSGPAVNVRPSGAIDGGIDHVPCLRLPWWPEAEAFFCRPRMTDFPSATTRRDIVRFGVHLVPTGQPGSATEQSEYRVSFSRAEVVTIRQLSPIQHQTITTVKGMKNTMKDSGAAPALKSYYVKTAVLWLAQDQPSERWTGVTAGVNMVLNWLEHRLSADNIPCFFWPSVNLVAGLQPAKLEDITNTVQLMRSQMNRLLMVCCDRLYGLDIILEGGLEPLSEPQLRLRLARLLLQLAVSGGTMYRSNAPCWDHWFRVCIPALPRLSQHRLLQCQYRQKSGTCQQQCLLLQALVVAPTDLMTGMRLASLGGDMFTWPVAPLTDLLTESDLEGLLGDPAAVAAWCRQQLCRPPAERPAGLTAELDTPRGRAELLLQPELYLRALRETVPMGSAVWQREEKKMAAKWGANYKPHDTYQQCREWLEKDPRCHLESQLRRYLPELDGPTVAATARLWWQNMQHLLSGDRLREAYAAVTTRWPDRWQLVQHLIQDGTSEGKTRHRDGSRADKRHKHNSHASYGLA